MTSAKERIDDIVRDNDIVLFMKGTALFPQCGFSSRAVAILDRLGAQYETVDVLQDPEVRQGIKDYADWPTVPQLYVKGEFIGGADIVREMFQAGELQDVLKEKGVAADAKAVTKARQLAQTGKYAEAIDAYDGAAT